MAIKTGVNIDEIKKRATNSPNMLDSGNIAERYAELIMNMPEEVKEDAGKEDVSTKISMEAEEKNKVVEIELDKIQPSRMNTFNAYPEKKMVELRDSIKTHGLIEPIIVRPRESVSSYSIDKDFEIIAGHNRYTAHKQLGLKTIRCAVVDIDDVTASIMISQSNIQRDINEIEIAKSYYETYNLLSTGSGGDRKSSDFKENQKCKPCTFESETGDTIQLLADRYGISRRTMANKIRLAQLTEKGQKLYLSKKLTQQQAIDISYAPEDMQEAFLDKYYQSMVKNCITPEMTKAFSDRAKECKKEKKTMAPNDIEKYVEQVRTNTNTNTSEPKKVAAEKEIKISIPESAFPSELKKQDRVAWVLNAVSYIKEHNIDFENDKDIKVS